MAFAETAIVNNAVKANINFFIIVSFKLFFLFLMQRYDDFLSSEKEFP